VTLGVITRPKSTSDSRALEAKLRGFEKLVFFEDFLMNGDC
jgi:hypothetical protein